MGKSDQRFTLDPPDHIVAGWSEWLKNGGYIGTLAETEQACLKSKGFDNWSECLFDIGIDWHFTRQKRKFWAFFAKTYPPQATVTQ